MITNAIFFRDFVTLRFFSWFCDDSIFFLPQDFFFPASRIFFLQRKRNSCDKKKILAMRKKLNCNKIKKKILAISNHFCESTRNDRWFSIEKKCSKLNAILKVVGMNSGSKFGAWVSFHTAIFQS